MRAEVDDYVDTRLADFGNTLAHMVRRWRRRAPTCARPDRPLAPGDAGTGAGRAIG